jgi:hypothetical protein
LSKTGFRAMAARSQCDARSQNMSSLDRMSPRERLAHSLKIRFRLPPDRPTDDELDAILRDVEVFQAFQDDEATEEDWARIVARHVPFKGRNLHEGLDFQDLNVLFALIQTQSQARKR